MEQEKKFGLIGKNISYSFSKRYFEHKFLKSFLKNHSYNLFDLENIEEVAGFLQHKDLSGLNVTIPYKTAIIPYLDELSTEAKEIGAVNCIGFKNGKKTGFNTDAFGFDKTLEIHLTAKQQSAIILGDGGAAKAVKYVLTQRNIPFQTVSRRSELNFENLSPNIISDNLLIIQATPVGTFPNVESAVPFPFEALSKDHLIIDLIYNPVQTQFLKKASERQARTANGYYMLEQQAEKAWKIWLDMGK